MTREVLFVAPDTSVREAALLMLDHRISGLPVMEDDTLVGIISEADYVAKDSSRSWRARVLLEDDQGPLSGAEKVGDLMSREPITIPVTASVHEAARLMTRAGFKRLPVIDDGRMVGIVTRSDLIRAYVRSDEDLADDAREMLAVLPEPLSRVAIAVSGAVITLSGEVRTVEEAQLVGRVVKGVEGIAGVDNQLVVAHDKQAG
ncbi:MAG TPA: CBS domain-containing protein [Acidimicrobiia bacterium]|nr:CBS domain-containing protein [Acidimicrobiia bacterium]